MESTKQVILEVRGDNFAVAAEIMRPLSVCFVDIDASAMEML